MSIALPRSATLPRTTYTVARECDGRLIEVRPAIPGPEVPSSLNAAISACVPDGQHGIDARSMAAAMVHTLASGAEQAEVKFGVWTGPRWNVWIYPYNPNTDTPYNAA